MEALEFLAVGKPRGHRLAFVGAEQHVFIEREAGDAVGIELELAGAGEALQFMRVDLDAAQVVALDVLRLDLVVEVILALQADGETLELHVQVLGDQDGGAGEIRLLDEEHGGEDAVVDALGVGEKVLETGDARGGFALRHHVVHGDADGAAAGGGRAVGDGGAFFGKDAAQLAMHGAGIGAALGLFVLEFVELAEDIDGNPDVVVRKALDAGGIVQQDVRVENVIFPRGCEPARLLELFLFCAGPGFDVAEEALLRLVFEVLRNMLVRIELVHGLRLGKVAAGWMKSGVKQECTGVHETQGRRKEFPEPEFCN